MHATTETHWSAAQRVLHYLKRTMHHGLFLKRYQNFRLTAFTDADWAGNHDDYTSTSAYIVYIGGNAISWCSKKQKKLLDRQLKRSTDLLLLVQLRYFGSKIC